MIMLFRSKGIFEGAKTANHLEELILHPGELATVPLEGLIVVVVVVLSVVFVVVVVIVVVIVIAVVIKVQ